MKVQLLKLYLNEFRKRKKKAALITFAIAWGTLSLLLMMSFGRGLSNQFRIGFHGLGIDLIMFSNGRTSRTYQGLPKGRRIALHKEDIDLVREQVPFIKRICAESYINTTITYNGKETNRTVHGVMAPFSQMRSMYAQMGGRFINPDDEKFARRVAYVGWNLADELFGKNNPIGELIYIDRTPFTVVGIMKKKLQNSNYQGFDYDHVFIPLSTLGHVSSQNFIDRLHLQPTQRKYSSFVENKTKALLGEKYRFADDDEYAVNIWNTIDQGKMAGNVFVGIEIFLGLMGGLTLLIGAVGVTNLMYAVVKERTREIGVKMAMGAKRRNVIGQFLLEALFIFVKGTFWGTLIAYNIVMLVRSIPLGYKLSSIGGYLLRPEFSSDILLIFVVIMGILVFVSGIFPALRASRLSPVDALRYE